VEWTTKADEADAAILEQAAKISQEDEFVRKSRDVTAGLNKDAAGAWNRGQEIIEYAKRMGYKTIGIAFCIGLKDEARVLADALASHGFAVRGMACSVDGPCNSVGQALLLNAAKTDMNILFGLCTGHDSLFLRFAEAPVLPFAVKDKVTCHNPVAALNCNYQRKRLFAD
jgi:uncharacterized metal-binding protein